MYMAYYMHALNINISGESFLPGEVNLDWVYWFQATGKENSINSAALLPQSNMEAI